MSDKYDNQDTALERDMDAETSWDCKHGYSMGMDCPECSVPSYWPEVLKEEHDELD